MREALKLLIKDILSGRNIELYVLVVLAVVIAVLDLFGVTDLSVVTAVILAVLAVLVYGRVQDQRRFEKLTTREELRGIRRFYPDRLSLPPLDGTLLGAERAVFIVGFTLTHLIHTQRSTLERIAQRGCKVKLATWAPPTDEPARTVLIENVEKVAGIADLEGFSANAVSRIRHWYDSLDSEARQNIEIRAYNTVPTSVVVFVDSDYPQGYVRVEPILYNLAPQEVPAFELGPSDAPALYRSLKEKYARLWSEAQSLVE